MARKQTSLKVTFKRGVNKRTSDGDALATRPKNKNARRQYKATRGQGHP